MEVGLLVSESFRHWVMRAERRFDSSRYCFIFYGVTEHTIVTRVKQPKVNKWAGTYIL